MSESATPPAAPAAAAPATTPAPPVPRNRGLAMRAVVARRAQEERSGRQHSVDDHRSEWEWKDERTRHEARVLYVGAHTASYDPKVQMDDLVQLAASAIAQIESITRRWPETMRTLQHLAGITTPGATLPAVGDGGQST